MSIVFSKRKEKRARTSSNETNTSFVKNVTSRVSGLLPSTITKWFSSPSSSSNANGSTPTADATDSSTEDEATESPIVTQPPAKRMRYNTSNKFNHFGPTDANCSTSNIEITEISGNSYPGTQFPINRNSITLTPIRTQNESIIKEAIKDKNERDMPRFQSTPHSISNIGQSVAAKRKSIFDKTSSEDIPKAKPSSSVEKKPCFKPSLLGSPFYPGRTMYGGAAASSYMSQPNIQQHTVALVKETKSSEDSVMSSSARRIMDLLESYSSPLMEARRIPQYTRPKNDYVNSQSDRFTPYNNRSLSYKTQELYLPSIASIMRLKQKSRLMDTTRTARQIIASHSSASHCPLTHSTVTPNASKTSDALPTSSFQPSQTRPEAEKDITNKMTTKIKSKVALTHRGNTDQVEMVTPEKLPSATLQIDMNNLPKFDFSTPAVTKSAVVSTKTVLPTPKAVEIKKNPEITKKNPETSKPDTATYVFKFSNPIKVSNDIINIDTTPPKFTFDSPERRIDQICDSKSDVSSVVGDAKESDKSATKPKDWQCPDCWVSNKADVTTCVCCGHKLQAVKVAKAAKCVVCKLADSLADKDKCVNCEKVANPTSAKSSQSKWKCNDCWVMNESDADKCACCGGKKPTEAGKAAAKAELATFSQFKVPPSCGGGFVLSPMPLNTQQVKPLQVPPATTTFFGSSSKTDDNAFISLAKTQKSDKWECSSCLVRNDSDKSECVCCGAEKESKSKLSSTKFNFGSTNTSFKFGIDPKAQEAMSVESNEKEQAETNNNVLANTPSFSFGFRPRKIEDKTGDIVTTKPDDEVKFIFGMPKDASASADKSEPAKITDKGRENSQAGFKSIFPASEEDKPRLDKDKKVIRVPKLFTPPPVEPKEDVVSNPVPAQPAEPTIQKPVPQNTFTLNSSTLKPATNLFGSPSSANTSTNLFTAAAPNTPVSTSTSSASLMLPMAPAKGSELPSTSAPAPALPVFSFGSNGASLSVSTPAPTVASAAAATVKPKFRFTFGSNNATETETSPSLMAAPNTQSVFKSPFGSTGDNNATNANTFSLPSGSTLGTNALGAGSLGSANGISTANGLPGNGLPNNTLGANTLGSNPLGTNTLGSNTLGNNTLGSNTLGNNTLGNNTLGNNTLGNNTLGSNSLGSNTLSANPLGGNTLSNNGMSSNMLGGSTMPPANAFSVNNMSGGNGATSTSILGGTNGLPGTSLMDGTGMQSNNTLTSNSITATPNIFGAPVQKENLWNSNNTSASTNLFVPSTTTNSLSKPAAFTFGATPFNPTSPPPAFGQPSAAQPAPNLFGMANPNQNNTRLPSLFSSPVRIRSPAPMFGSPPPSSNASPQVAVFGSPNMGATPTFGAPNPIPSFEAPSMTPSPAPTFHFGAAAQQPPAVFGFGQQQPQQQAQQPGVYNFGSPQAGPPQVQFSMGTAPNTSGRRVRKAVRRTTPR